MKIKEKGLTGRAADQRRDLINGAGPKKFNAFKLADGPKAGKEGKKDGESILLYQP
jgi:hypothetical protein